MANILVNDILDELREEIKTLSKKNEVIHNLLDKYRKCLIHLQTICECNQKCNNKILVDSLESLYKTSLNFQNRETNELKDTKKKVIKEVNKSIENIEIQFIKTKELDNNLVKTNDTNVENKQILCNENKGSDILIDNKVKEEIADMDSDYELSDQNDSHSNDSSGEEVDSNSKDFYKCEECYQLFDNEFELNFHKTTHLSASNSSEREQTSNEVNGCQYCEKSYKSKNALKLHIQRKHWAESGQKKPLAYDCEHFECEKSYSENTSLLKHIRRKHCPKDLECDECERRFVTNNELKQHKQIHSKLLESGETPTRAFVCQYGNCYKAFKSDISLEIHIQRTHRPQSGQTSDDYICMNNECKRVFKKKDSLIRHIISLHKPEAKPHKCEECDKYFVTRMQLRRHLNSSSHKYPNGFKCEQCNQFFENERTFTQHKEVIHSSQPIVFKCKKCQYETRFKSALVKHIRKVHEIQELTVKCEYEGCPKLFRTKHLMQKHRNVKHSSFKFVCDWPGCDFSTTRKISIKDHSNSHIGVKQFKCNFEGCPKTFVRNSNLLHHRRRHMKCYVCSWPECGHRFSDEKCLTAHMNGHMNVRPFKCYIDGCDKDYTNDKQMKQHIRAVHQIKPK